MFYVTSENMLNRGLELLDTEWHCFTGSQYDPKTHAWTMSKIPVHRIIEGFELLRT